MEELLDGVVFRLAAIQHDFPPDSPTLRFWHFELSGHDKAPALYRELRVRLADLSFRLAAT